MKNKLYYIFGLFMCFIFIGGVYAEGITITVESNATNVIKGENREVTIKLNSDKVISKCQFKVENDSNIVFVNDSIKGANGWSFTGNITDGFEVTKPNESTVTPNGGILNLSYSINGDGKLTVKDIKCVVEEDSSEKTHENVEVNFTTIDAVDDTTLRSLSIKDGTAIDFKSDVYGPYLTSIETSKFALEFETSNPDYIDKVVVKDSSGNVIDDVKNITFNDPTNQGAMNLSIIVNDITTYNLLVTYREKTYDNSLEYIKINGSNLTLVNDKLDYTLDVSSDVNNVEVIVGLKDTVNFKIGNNSNIDVDTLRGNFSITDTIDINIIVEPKDSSLGAVSKTYTIHIKKNNGSTVIPGDDEDEVVNPPVEDDDEDDVIVNPSTGDISMFVMILILISSLIVSVLLYRKNLESYK